jgi:transposase-like protein
VVKPARRTFSASYEARIVAEADACSSAGEVGRLLRREGLYSSHLAAWRKAQREGAFGAVAGRKRGPNPQPDKARDRELRRLERENARLREGLGKAQLLLDVQGKVSRLLEMDLNGERNF